MRGPSPAVASGVHFSSRCTGLSPLRPLLLRSTGSRRAGSAIVAHRPSRSTACGILPDQGSNPCPLHWQADSQPLCHQGSPVLISVYHFALFCSLAVISTLLSSSSFICCCSVILLLISSSVFFVSIIVLFNTVSFLGVLGSHYTFLVFS